MCIGLLQKKINKHPYTVLVCINCCLIKLGNNTKDSTISYNDRRSKTVYCFHFIFLAARHLVIFIWLRIWIHVLHYIHDFDQTRFLLYCDYHIVWISREGLDIFDFEYRISIFTIEMSAVTLNVQWQQLFWSCIMVWGVVFVCRHNIYIYIYFFFFFTITQVLYGGGVFEGYDI